MNALVVDDQPQLGAIFSDLLRNRGHVVSCCTSAEDAQAACGETTFDLVLLDLGLPGMDGLTFCRWLRNQPGGHRSLVIAITGDLEEETLLDVLDAGADDFVMKPVRADFLSVRLAVAERHATDRQLGEHIRAELQESERVRREEELLNSSRVRALLEHHVDIVTVLGLDGTRKYISPSAESLLGFSQADLIGQDGLQLIHEDDRDVVRAAMEQLVANPGAHPVIQLRLAHKDGNWRDFEAIATNLLNDPSVGGIVFNSRDVTDRNRALEAQRESEQRFLLSFEHAPIGMAIIGLDGTCLDANRALSEISGFSRDDLVGRVLDELRHPEETPFDPNVLLQMQTGAVAVSSFERRYLDREGQEFWILVNLSLVRGRNHDPLYYVAQLVNVSERKRAEKALRESEERFRLFVESALDCVISIDSRGRVTEFNPAAERTFGYRREQVVGQQLEMLIPEDLRSAHVAGMKRYLRTGTSKILNQRIEIESIRANGERFPVELAISPVTIGDEIAFVSYMRDITERLRLQTEIERREQRFRSLVQNATEIISVMDRDYRRLYVSPGIESVLGYQPGELVGRTDVVRVHPDDETRSDAIFAKLIAEPEEAQRDEVRLQHRNGEWRWFEMTVMNRLDDPAVNGFIVNARDVTEHKSAQLELAEALRVQTEANRQLTELNRDKSDFISIVSHEFRTPLTSIQGFSELILEHPLDEATTQEFAGLIHQESMRLNRLIKEMLDFDRLKSGKMKLQKVEVNVDELLDSTLRGFAAVSTKHTFASVWPRPLPVIHADLDKITQVMANLLSNSVKYSPDGGAITVGGTGEPTGLHLWIKDEGIGIAEEAIEYIFERYTRVESKTHRRIEGTGLGLAIVKQIIELHHGEVWVESEKGVGSIFHIRLPYE